mgnify:CR=1 FL=1
MKKIAKTSTKRQAELKARREAAGMVRRPYWATPEEHEALKAKLRELRN